MAGKGLDRGLEPQDLAFGKLCDTLLTQSMSPDVEKSNVRRLLGRDPSDSFYFDV